MVGHFDELSRAAKACTDETRMIMRQAKGCRLETRRLVKSARAGYVRPEDAVTIFKAVTKYLQRVNTNLKVINGGIPPVITHSKTKPPWQEQAQND
jgi:hypothetical protein